MKKGELPPPDRMIQGQVAADALDLNVRGGSSSRSRRGRVCRAGGERERRRLRDRASSLESGQSGGVGGSWRDSRGAAWYWGGGGGPPLPWISHVGVWWRQRLVVWVE